MEKIHVLITWHSEDTLKQFWLKEKLTRDQFIQKYIIDNLNTYFQEKEKYIFHVWWCDWWDNMIWNVLSDMWYEYELFVPYFDINWRKYWNSIQNKEYDNTKKNAKTIHIVDWSYLKRNRELAKWCTSVFSFIKKMRSWTKYTIDCFYQNNKRDIPNLNIILIDFL